MFFSNLLVPGTTGTREGDAQAVAHYRKAADQGMTNAQWILGMMYEDGQGVPQDYVAAHKWYNLEASRGTASDEWRTYIEARDRVARKMTPAQLAEAQQLAREWQAAFEKRQVN